MGDRRAFYPPGTAAERLLRRGPRNRQSAYTGRYTVTANHIDYVDYTGFTATGDVLFHEHLVLYREGNERTRDGGTRSHG
ncbi:putative oligopeptide transporter (OPT) family protein [Streptomyces sp. SAI-163]